jgi:RNA polymerase sigma factor (TIGR02999 family)
MSEKESTQHSTEVTQLLSAVRHDPKASERLLPVVYEELRAMARAKLAGERQGHTLQATALVHEAFVKMVEGSAQTFQSRSHFFGACANAMRQILVDHARAKTAAKRGGSAARASLESHDVADTANPEMILMINDAIDQLRDEDERAAKVVELRFFGGMEMSEIAMMLDASERSVQRDWAFARTRLFQLLHPDSDATPV